MANVKIIVETEISDEVLGRLFEALRLPKPEELTSGKPELKLETPRAIEVEVSNVGGKLTARLLTEREEGK